MFLKQLQLARQAARIATPPKHSAGLQRTGNPVQREQARLIKAHNTTKVHKR